MDQHSENQLSDAELEQVTGGSAPSAPSAPLIAKPRVPITSWSGTPYSPEEDVSAY